MARHEHPVIAVDDASVRYESDAALDGVGFRLFPGEVHSLMGENGAGKSTLVKGLTGALQFDSGTIALDGERVAFPSPAHAQAAGVRAVYQEINLLPNLSVAENIMLGREPRRWWGIDWRTMRQQASAVLADLGLDVDPGSLLGTHSLAVQQLVAIARAVSGDVRVLVLDEPTSSLDVDEVAELFRVMRELKERGVAILFISHFLDQVYEICDRVTVLRGGKLVGEYLTSELLRIDLVEKMLGSSTGALAFSQRDPEPEPTGAPVLDVRGLSGGPVSSVDLELLEGEVLGLAGLLGSGRTELARLLTGVDPVDSGSFALDGRARRPPRNPRAAIRLGLTYSSENRRTEGIIGELTVRENITLALQAQRGMFRRIGQARQRELAASWIEALGIRPSSPEQLAGVLSGGHQQKVLLARLLALAPRVLVLDEPTRGIDIGAKAEVQRLVVEMAANGMSVVFISAELEEVLRVSGRILVLRDGRIVQSLSSNGVSAESLLALIARPDD